MRRATGECLRREVDGRYARIGDKPRETYGDAAASGSHVERCGSGDSLGRGGCDQLLGFGTRDQNAFADFEGHAAELGMRQHVLHGASGGQLADGLFEVGDVGLRFGGRRRIASA